jgi:cbb3-type cytochrome oxidase subunit 3
MNLIWGQVIGFFTVAVMVAFIGIWIWVWHPNHKRKFDSLSKLPLEDSQ